MTIVVYVPALFPLGTVLITPGADQALADAGQAPEEFLVRHALGDWGEVDESDWRANNRAVRLGTRILSAYRTNKGEKLWLITEWDRTTTTLLLPDEY